MVYIQSDKSIPREFRVIYDPKLHHTIANKLDSAYESQEHKGKFLICVVYVLLGISPASEV